ncbi:MAG: SDR family NAD(P)-dependent oxidoreductase, partial [Fervidicoccus sp.]
MCERLKDRVVVITGAARGIGYATAMLAAKEGAKVAVCDVLEDEGKKAAEEIKRTTGNQNVKFYRLDVTNEDEVKRTFEQISKDLGDIYGLVNNAGIAGVSKPTHEITLEEWNKVINVNLNGVFLCTKHAVPYMIKNNRGSIVNLSSIYGIVGAPDVP